MDRRAFKELLLGGLAAVAIPAAAFAVARAPRSDGAVAVLFRPDLSPGQVLQRLADVDARLIRMAGDNVAIVEGRPGLAAELYRNGALFVGASSGFGLCAGDRSSAGN